MAALALTTLNGSGEVVMTAAAALGDTVPNTLGKTIFRVANGGGAPITVSATAQVPCDEGLLHNLSVVVTNGKTIDIILDKRLNSQTTGLVSISYTGVGTVTVGAYQVNYRS